jgi:aminoglycoside phosphotransferase (APT) family kinase protein
MTGEPPNAEPPGDAARGLTLEVARAALSEALPEIDLGDLKLIGSGNDFHTFGIDLRWVARFPRHAAADRAIEAETRTMPTLAHALADLGVDVPEVRATAQCTSAWPHPFLVQRRIWGLPIESVGPARFAIRMAAHLGQALGAVHALDTPAGFDRAQGDEREYLRHAAEAAADLSSETRARVPAAIDWLNGDPQVPAEHPGEPRLLHNDLWPEHIRAARTGLGVIGIFDWSDIAVGDPARDFAPLYCWAGPSVLDSMMLGYELEVDDGFPARVRFMARVESISSLREAEARGGDVEKHVGWTMNAFSGD